MYQSNSPERFQKPLPTMYDLPSEDPEEPGLPDEFHVFQPQLLRETCQPKTYSADEIFIGTDINLYYDSRHTLWHKRPDWFLVLGVPPAKRQQELRWSYVIWQEGVNPFLVVELLSPGTEEEDLGRNLREIQQPPGKWEVYERILRIPYYALYDRYENRFRLFELRATRYQGLEIRENRHWFEELELGLGLWEGEFQSIRGLWLRWYDQSGNWILTGAERAEQAQQRAEQAQQQAEQAQQQAEQAQQQAEQAQQRAEKLAARLRELNIDPDQI